MSEPEGVEQQETLSSSCNDLRSKDVEKLLSLEPSALAVEYNPEAIPAVDDLDEWMAAFHAAVTESNICDWETLPKKPTQGIHCLALRMVTLPTLYLAAAALATAAAAAAAAARPRRGRGAGVVQKYVVKRLNVDRRCPSSSKDTMTQT